ncbi:MAG: hypothetical protein JRD89_01050 [Deltaproteobacteria bacterium]|nr:hypothetical protein [Deltaproteobacteria bacterium]
MVRLILYSNLVVALILVASAVMGIGDTFADIRAHGWRYTKEVHVGTEITEEQVDNVSSVASCVFLIWTGLVSVGLTTVALLPIRSISPAPENNGLTFTSRAKPEDWSVDIIVPERRIAVNMNDFSLSIPARYILDAFRGEEK